MKPEQIEILKSVIDKQIALYELQEENYVPPPWCRQDDSQSWGGKFWLQRHIASIKEARAAFDKLVKDCL